VRNKFAFMGAPRPPCKKQRKIGRPRVERVDHVIEIEDWDWDYMFGIDNTKFRSGPYMDFRHLVISGKK
jgi:hypothetical protein